MLKQDTEVIIKNLGDTKEYNGKIVGVVLMTSREVNETGDILQYLVELHDDFEDYEYSVIAITPACVEEK